MHFRIPYQIGTAHDQRGFLHLDGHTNLAGHALITGTLGVQAVEKRLRETLDTIARDIEQAGKQGALIE